MEWAQRLVEEKFQREQLQARLKRDQQDPACRNLEPEREGGGSASSLCSMEPRKEE